MAPQNESHSEVKMNGNGGSYHFIERVSGLPMVHSALETAKYVYDGTKIKLPIIAQVETGLSQRVIPQLLQTSEPIVRVVDSKLHFSTLDGYACKGLDVIEKNMPIVKETPQDIVDSGKSMVDSYIFAPVNGVVQKVEGVVEGIITYSEKIVDSYTEKEEKVEQEENADAIVVNGISNKIARVQTMGKRIGTTALHKIQKTPQEILSMDIVKHSTAVVEKQVKWIRETYTSALQTIPNAEHMQKIFDGYVKDLTTRVEKVRQVVNKKSVNIRETIRAALLSLSEGLNEFSTKANKSISEFLAREDVKSYLPLKSIEASLATLKTVSDKLTSLASKYTVILTTKKPKSIKKKGQQETELEELKNENESH